MTEHEPSRCLSDPETKSNFFPPPGISRIIENVDAHFMPCPQGISSDMMSTRRNMT